MNILAHERLIAVLRYEPDTGDFFWRGRKAVWMVAGAKAGTPGQKGYTLIRVDHKTYRAHRLAWFYVHGEYPVMDLDHRNGKPADNRIANLRLATSAQNAANMKAKNPRSGFKGVTKVGSRYHARICKDRRTFHLGMFPTAEAAHAAYTNAAKRLHGEFARTT